MGCLAYSPNPTSSIAPHVQHPWSTLDPIPMLSQPLQHQLFSLLLSSPVLLFLFIPFLFFSLVKVEEEATDKDNKNCSKDNMCSKVIGLKTNSICAL